MSLKDEALSGHCPVCEGEALSVYRRQKVHPVQRPYSITRPFYGITGTLARCLACGLIFVHPMPSEASLRSLYETMKDEAYFGEEAMRRAMAERILRWLERFSRKGRLLDVGCFSGFFLDVARKRGWEGVGVEPSGWARRIAEERFGLQVFGGSVAEARFPDASFDSVTLIDTLEHLRDPKETLAEARRILKPEGVLYLSTPDVGSVACRLLGKAWWGFRQEHLVYFSKDSLSFLLEQTLGYTVLSRRPFLRVLTLEAILRRLKERHSVFYPLVWPLGQIPGVGERPFGIHFFDQIEWVARKG